jgi:indolepyruvate ferredoxin oxidoreductase alpha subunit
LLGASIHYPLRGAVTWKSIVGTNVASDALSNLASAGVTGGAVIVVGEDYGEGASVIQERTHATALKSSLVLLDPQYHMPTLVRLTETAFDLSEACHLPVILSLRIRAAHMTGSFVCRDNRPPRFGAKSPIAGARYDYGRIVLPPSTYAQEKNKIEERLPAARRFIVEHGLNEHLPGDGRRMGIVMQGGVHTTVLRGLRLLGAADPFGETPLPLLVLNVVHPLVPDQIASFLAGKDSILVVEEGNPPFVEQQIRAIAQERGIACRVFGKDILPEAGEYTANVVRAGLAAYLGQADAASGGLGSAARDRDRAIETDAAAARAALETVPPPRPPSFCTGCPERPVFTALKLLQRERGPLHISSDIGCNTFSTLPPFNMGSTVLGYGMSLASSGAVGPALGQPAIAVMGDGGFWHNGLVSGAVNAQWNGHDAVLVILENGYASATGQQHVPSTGSTPWGRPVRVSIERTLRAIGVRWLRRVHAYDVTRTMHTLRRALDARGKGLRVVISDAECMLARRRRERRRDAERSAAGKPVAKARYGVDEEVCVGDHSCMRLNGCPSLTLRAATDPLKAAPTATVDPDCAACDLCGGVAHAAKLCPSFYKASGTVHPGRWQAMRARLERRALAALGAS